MKTNPCLVCEEYNADVKCDVSDCPVRKLLEENKILKKKVSALKKKVEKLESDASWAEDIRRGCVQGMW